MSTKYENVLRLVGATMDSGIKCICKRLNKSVPVLLVLRDVMLSARKDCLVLSPGSAVGMWTIRRSREVLDSKQGGYLGR